MPALLPLLTRQIELYRLKSTQQCKKNFMQKMAKPEFELLVGVSVDLIGDLLVY